MPAPTPANQNGPKPRVYLALEGGGAKGFAHVGALRAIEHHTEIEGMAGASAGAVVAALKSAGFTADDLINTKTRTTLLDWLKERDVVMRDATQFFGRLGWWRVRSLRAAFRLARGGGRSTVVILTATAVLSIGAAALLGPILAMAAAGVWLAVVFRAGRGLLSGLSSAGRFRTILDSALKLKLRGSLDGEAVTFAEMAAAGCTPLKVVATDLTAGRLRLFSAEDTPDIAVCDAVTASVCLPIVFSIWSFPLVDEGADHAFLDGGLVSNLPAWPFDEERTIDQRAVTLAVEIAEPEGASATSITRFNWPIAALRTSIFGASVLNKRAIGRLETLVLPSALGVLQFDAKLDAVVADVENAARAAEARLVKRVVHDPWTLREAAEAARRLTGWTLEQLPEVTRPRPDRSPRVRAAIAMFENADHRKTLKLSPCVGFEGDSDEEIVLPIEGSLVGKAWKDRVALFQALPFARELDLPGVQNDLRRRLIWKDMTWSLAIPILAGEGAGQGTPILAVVLDGDHILPDDVESFRSVLGQLAVAIQENVLDIAQEIG
ncbi:hypothetical protein GCM10008174_10500 [Methylopila turkensis]|uniref:PNPLA domain-containing protein n=1 Tax=Methylopila turkensis TaxID=1437816 RepID=A0A9W6JP59_9HYPH|nr:hypothetical protein GCM10008174_10500 [Methylopila turkensis]